VLGTDLRRGRGHQACQRSDQFPGLVQVLQVLGVLLRGKPELDGCGAHQVDGGGGDDLDGRYLGNVPDLLGDVAAGVGGLENV
jgi:hypothetical protein